MSHRKNIGLMGLAASGFTRKYRNPIVAGLVCGPLAIPLLNIFAAALYGLSEFIR